MRSFFVLLLLAACSSSAVDPRLVVSVRTDYTPFREFDAVLLRFGSGDAAQEIPRIVRETDNYARGQQVADPRLALGVWRVTGELVRGGRTIATRAVSLEITEGDASVTLLFTRSCENVSCPNDNPAFDTCLGGRCVDPRCTPETPEFCPTDPQCEAAVDCTMGGSTCVATTCEDAVCFERPEASACDVGQVCDYETGCLVEFPDGGPPDMIVDMAAPDMAEPDMGVPDTAMPEAGLDMAEDMMDLAMPDMRDAAPPPPLACVVASEPSDVLFFDFDADVVDVVSGRPGLQTGTRLEPAGPCGGNAIAMPTQDDFFLIPDRASFDLAEGSLDFWAFLAAPGGAARSVIARDAEGTDTPGHLSMAIMPDGTLATRLQLDGSSEGVACSAPLTTDAWHRIGLNFGPGGLELWVDGARQNASGMLMQTGYDWVCQSPISAGIAGNDNPITLGFPQIFSSEGGIDVVPTSGIPPQVSYPGLRIDNLRLANVRRDYAAERYPD